jgi:hypothetical protein
MSEEAEKTLASLEAKNKGNLEETLFYVWYVQPESNRHPTD